MMLTSKRCFINCVAQFMDRQTIANANYYIIDVSNNSRRVEFEKEIVFDEETGAEIIREKPVQSSLRNDMSAYHVVYSDGILDPRQNVLSSTSGTQIGSDYSSGNGVSTEAALDAYQKYLMQPSTIGNVYDWLYSDYNKPRGNGLQILIINDEDNVKVFGHTIAVFLSQVLGEDVQFIDPQIRPELVKGYANYTGNKANAERILRDQRDYSMLDQFIGYISMMGYSETKANMQTFLNKLEPVGLMHLYEMLFPNDPLPPGNYTTEEVKVKLIGKAMEVVPNYTTSVPSLRTSNSYLDSITAELERLSRR